MKIAASQPVGRETPPRPPRRELFASVALRTRYTPRAGDRVNFLETRRYPACT